MTPDHETIRAALALAVRAPSVHNTQPWSWRIGDRSVQLYADCSRRLPHADPDSRELLLSCGAALHHLRVAMRSLGWDTEVHRLPNPADPMHLASVEFHRAAPDEESVRLARAISQRRSDRRRFTSWEIPDGQLAHLIEAGDMPGVRVHTVDSPGDRSRLMRAFQQAAEAHAADPAYLAELAAWSGHHADPEGVPARNAVAATGDPTVRPFADPRLAEAVLTDTESARMLLLRTSDNDLLAWLRAGEAASAIMLAATVRGLASCLLTEPVELPAVRERIRTELLGGFGHPQLVIRMGWAASSADPIPATPRLPLDAVVRPLEPADRG
ncbi:Acg family FMN-binding oxidoreductase [Nocardia seriolae]|uniref:NAD(P)H nitroreductase n=1 Tax=Nocardia seriolae TaxID=37332 RepID=A0ABC9YW39_9NOCA|nr:nitroreductase family protein [Nocardia seriolae]BEK95448.1 NAD(P)H nitroreductase [Nocardia seriolae]GAM47861.1 nitroreductase [Nocardia seriolae]GAP29698.1 NAD(P)H nitroreductase [Nocardia seriolae]